MKPRNFPGRRQVRRTRAYRRFFKDGVLIKQCHEVFILNGFVQRAALTTLEPTDIRIRMGAEARKESP